MIREVETRESLKDVIRRGTGYIYNDFGGAKADDCLIHRVDCPHAERMLSVPAGKLSVKKVWSEGLLELVKWCEARGKVYSRCDALR